MSDYADKQPWLDIPNPFGFTPLYDQINHIYPLTSPNYSGAKSKVHRRTAPVGRDWLGVGFQKGDIILGSVGKTNELLEVDEIFLDDGRGNPYGSWTGLVLEKSSGRVFKVIRQWDPVKRAQWTELQAVEMSWIGNQLGLLGSDADLTLGDGFIALHFQSFRVRAKALVTRSWDSGAKRSLAQHQVTVLGQDADRELLDLRLACSEIPLVGDPERFIPKS